MPSQQDREGLVCHCFGYTAAHIREDFLQHGHSQIMERIVAEKKEGGCRCATANPSGR